MVALFRYQRWELKKGNRCYQTKIGVRSCSRFAMVHWSYGTSTIFPRLFQRLIPGPLVDSKAVEKAFMGDAGNGVFLLVGYVSAIMMQKYDGFKLWDGQESSKQRTDSLGWWFVCFVLTVFAPQDGEIRTEDIGHLQSRLIVCFGSKFTANCRWIRNAV